MWDLFLASKLFGVQYAAIRVLCAVDFANFRSIILRLVVFKCPCASSSIECFRKDVYFKLRNEISFWDTHGWVCSLLNNAPQSRVVNLGYGYVNVRGGEGGGSTLTSRVGMLECSTTNVTKTADLCTEIQFLCAVSRSMI